ncbi:hypothetical protein PR202_ga00220 [Eleusine coracana subsp. coracana]|uniref:Tetrapyrrole methylase domain-containing protein n=1 Tax=Eleusine coracana subsp. coracana TaxID=191504 RepID=A0AAV5BBN1_ELECO|nr:hypothetical protein PR202_ga00220 [Eleusine coracana subsp. coracana]
MASLLRFQALVAPAVTIPCCRGLPSPLRMVSVAIAPLAPRLSTAAFSGSPEHAASEQDLESGLYLVATPIGNLEDITLRSSVFFHLELYRYLQILTGSYMQYSCRALRVLKCAAVILSEDTRHSGKLLHHYNIKTPLLSFHKFNEREREPSIIKRLHEGQAVALISDAGTPGISDPGMELARLCATEKIPVIPIPGPSAAIAALSASGLPSNEFTFVGFFTEACCSVKEEKDLRYLLVKLQHKYSMFLLMAFINFLSCVIAREITKLHEEFWRGTLGEASEAFATRQPKGEITILIEGKLTSDDETPSEEFLEHELKELTAKGHTLSAVQAQLNALLHLKFSAKF